MDQFTRSELHQLLSRGGDQWKVSLYAPMHVAGPETRANASTVRKLLSMAEKDLELQGARKPEIRTLLEPAEKLLGETPFWQNQSAGLALFLDDEGMLTLRLNADFLPGVQAGKSPHRVRPLFRLTLDEKPYHILAFSQNRVRLLRCGTKKCVLLEPQGMPANLEEAIRNDDPSSSLQARTAGNTPLFHGHGGGEEDSKKDVQRFVRLVFQTIQDPLRETGGPLVLACVDSLASMFREVSGYREDQLVVLPGNPDALNERQLQEQATGLLKEYLHPDTQVLAGKIREGLGRRDARFSSDPEAVLEACGTGRVETLLVAEDYVAENDEALEEALRSVFLQGGQVLTAESGLLEESPLMAVFRY